MSESTLYQWKWSLGDHRDALSRLPDHYQEIFHHGSMKLGLYAPRGKDDQDPHDQDELYFISNGSAGFTLEDKRTDVSAGDALFVPAGLTHRFDTMSDDFMVWVIFWGPKGGEDSHPA